MIQTEVTTPTPVFRDLAPGETADALFKTSGWARRPLFNYNAEQIAAPRAMITESDCYIVFSTTHLFLFEVVNSGWTRYISITALSIREKKAFTKIIYLHNRSGLYFLPSESESSSIRIKHALSQVHFIIMKENARIIKFDIPHFGGDNSLRGELVLTQEAGMPSIVTNLPFNREKGRFRYTRCCPCFFAEGAARYENKDIIFSQGRSWGIFLWRRMARPARDVHYWASGSGKSGGKRVSFSIGCGSVNASRATENAFFVNDNLYKLEYVTFIASPLSWHNTWRFTSSDGRLSMRFDPLESAGEYYASFLRSASVRRIFGFFSGSFQPPAGPAVEFFNITGVTERRKTRR
ncbi:MAG: DUF2804 domain-containing protein [Spirochaetaceae bacterium]|jgi:hypothetical protein|nr:DUF2804 domain-containing protein [Spirochaetaceae bacterium]